MSTQLHDLRTHDVALTTKTLAKRRWTERDWDVIMEAQSFVAVFADAAPASTITPTTETKKTTKSKNKKTAKRTKSVAPSVTRRSKRSKTNKVTEDMEMAIQEDDGEQQQEQVPTTEQETFWLAQLQDDVTEDMLDDADAGVRITWLNCNHTSDKRYEMAYDDRIDVQTILCHVFLDESTMQLTTKSAARVERSLRRTRGEQGDDLGDESEDELPPVTKRASKRKVVGRMNDDDDDGNGGRSKRGRAGRGGSGSKTPKMTKRMAAMHIPPRYTTVDLAKYDDRELLGASTSFDACKGDLLSANREIMRAVRTQNHDLLKSLVEDKALLKQIYSFSAYQSVDVKKTVLQYARDADNVKTVALILEAQKLRAGQQLASAPSVSLPSHSTGSHTSSFSDYNRRAINASRGGKEGNNALLEDCDSICDDEEESNSFWSCPTSTVAMLTALQPTGEWVNDSDTIKYVALAARAGNYKLVSKMVEVLSKNGGWGYNDLHVAVLSAADQELPAFRSVSVVKKSQQTKITPLHFAAINPNAKYLEALWDNVGGDVSDVRDDAQFEPIHYAAANESPSAVRFLLEKKANLLSRTKTKHTPLMLAILNRRQETAIAMLEFVATEATEFSSQVLTSKGPDLCQLIHFAAQTNCLDVLKHLLKLGADVNVLSSGQTTALSLAARAGHYECVELLLAHGAKVDRADKLGRTPLLLAVKNGHTRLAALLINNGANVNAYDSSENSIVHYAASYGWLSCLELLFDCGADVWSRNSWGFVPLICAMLKQRMLCVDFILASDTEQRFLDFRDRSGCTMLFLQCQHSTNLDQIKYLLDKGLDPNIGNCDDEHPLGVLIQRARSSFSKNPQFYLDAVRALVQHGAVVNLMPRPVEGDDETPRLPAQPLHTAIRYKLKEIFEFLLCEANADPFLTESNGMDAWLTSASLGSEGTAYLETLFDRFPAPQVLPDGIFHQIARSSGANMVRVDTVEKLMTYFPNMEDLMHEKNGNGLTPLMTLYQSQRSMSNQLSPEAVAEYTRQDTEFSKMARLFASKITDIEALKQYVSVKQSGAVGEEDVYVSVLNSTIFHIANRRNLRANSTHVPWFGDDLVRLILETIPASKTLIDVPMRTNHETLLLMAVEKNDDELVRLALTTGADPNYSPVRCQECGTQPKQCSGCASRGYVDTPLVRAVGKLSLMKLLLKFGAKTNCVASGSLDTPLHMAMKSGHADQTKLLLDHQSSMVTQNNAKSTPLASAIAAKFSVSKTKPHEGEIEFTPNTFGRGAQPTSRQMLVASSSPSGKSAGHSRTTMITSSGTVIDVALAHDAALPAIVLGDKHARTSLHHAAATRDLPLLRSLLQRVESAKHKADLLNTRDVYGRTTLHFALNTVTMNPDASFDVERFLLLSGADAHAVDNFGLSPLHFALAKIDMDWHHKFELSLGQTQVAELKTLGVYETTKAEAFKKHLQDASSALADPVETLSNLIAAGCDPRACDALGRSPMHLAASIGAFVCASILLSASPLAQREELLEQQDIDGFTPLGRAFERARETAITTLIQSGASVSSTVTIRGQARSYFSVAVEKSMWGICHMLLNAGFSRRQAVEDAVRAEELQLAKNLMVGLEISNDRGLLVAGNSHGQTLVHVLAMNSSTFGDLAAELAWTLVDDGLDVTAQDEEGNTALHYAAARGNTKLMDFLLHHGCDVNGYNHQALTPLMFALSSSTAVGKESTVLQYMLTRSELDLRLCDPNGLDFVALFVRHALQELAHDAKLVAWFEMAVRRHGDLNRVFAAKWMLPSAVFSSNVVANKLGFAAATDAPLLILATYAGSMDTRLQLLRVLLQHGASPSSVDAHGNTVVMHLATRNMLTELALVLDETKATAIRMPELLNMANHQSGRTALHLAVEPLAYGSYENVKLLELLVDNGASLTAKDKAGETVLDYTARQASRFVFRFLKTRYPAQVQATESDLFDEEMGGDDVDEAPAFDTDADEYLDQCFASGKIVKTRVAPTVARNCDVGQVKSVFGLLDDATGEVMEGEEYDALLTKVDVKHGQFGVNVFYRTQVVLDGLQNIYIVFTNWGRIGEDGKFQNTPFHNAADAVAEFKKIFKSKTSNAWEDRHAFEKRRGKYALVQRVNYKTQIDNEITYSFTTQLETFKNTANSKNSGTLMTNADAQRALFAPVQPGGQLKDASVVNTLLAVSDVRYLVMAASQDCQYYNDLPLARDGELRSALAMLQEIRLVLQEQVDVKQEMATASASLATDETAADVLSELSDKYAALAEDISERSSRFYEIVPCNERHGGGAIRAFESVKKVDKQVYRLTKLLDITHTYKMLLGAKLRAKTIHPMEYVANALQIQMHALPVANQERELLSSYFFNGLQASSRKRFRVSNVFAVTRKGESKRFASCLKSDPLVFTEQRHTSLLWHGTRRTNLMGILSEGLRIAPPEAPHHGYAYGKGIYFADVAAKSLQYCDSPYTIEEDVEKEATTAAATASTTPQPTTRTREVQYLLLCEVALGVQRNVGYAQCFDRESLAKDNFHSICAVGQHVPNGHESLVSPVSGVQVPVGAVGRPGRDYARATAWAICPSNLQRSHVSYAAKPWTWDAEMCVDNALLRCAGKLKVGDRFQVQSLADKKLFVAKGYYSDLEENAVVEICVTAINGDSTTTPTPSGSRAWDVEVKIMVTPPLPETTDDGDETEATEQEAPTPIVVVTARRSHHVYYGKPQKLGKGFSLQELSPAGQYNEHVVFATEQARIRYLVEVEHVKEY